MLRMCVVDIARNVVAIVLVFCCHFFLSSLSHCCCRLYWHSSICLLLSCLLQYVSLKFSLSFSNENKFNDDDDDDNNDDEDDDDNKHEAANVLNTYIFSIDMYAVSIDV